MPFISVCIPSFNRSELLLPLLETIQRQDFHDYEIVIAEDCSPDRKSIRAICHQFKARYSLSLNYFENKKNLGYDANLRNLISLAKGEYVLFIGNDDLLAPGALSAIHEALNNQSNVGVLLRSYSSFFSRPEDIVQTFRYFHEDRVFPPGSATIATFFRRCVFISGMVLKRSAAHRFATNKFDGTLLYQQYLVGRILESYSGYYLHQIVAYHRLGGVPDFGSSESEKGLHTPKQQTLESSIHFMTGMVRIAKYLDYYHNHISMDIIKDIGNYSYPILSVQANLPLRRFISYIKSLSLLGLWKSPYFLIYSLALVLFRKKFCDWLIARIKMTVGRSPKLGKFSSGFVVKK
jgi:abequosyltransferase